MGRSILLDSWRSICDKFKESSFFTKEQEEQNTKKEKNKLCVLKTFRECLPKKKKIENKQSDIKLTWSNHKKMSFAVTMSPYHSELLFKVSTAI